MEAVSTATVLTILGSAYGVMFATMISLLFVSIRAQHRENSKTRELMARSDKETRELIARTDRETRIFAAGLIERFGDRLKALVTANHKATQEQFKTVNETLIDIRERLSFLEGAKHANAQHDEDGNQTSEAA